MSSTAITPPLPARHPWLRLWLAFIALVILYDAIPNVSAIFADYGNETSLLAFAQALTSVKLALTPLLAFAALILVLVNRPRHAIVALAALIFVAWLTDLPSLAINGLELSATVGGIATFCFYFLSPLVAAAAAWLAMRDQRLTLAAILVSLPTIFAWLGLLIFMVMVWTYGF